MMPPPEGCAAKGVVVDLVNSRVPALDSIDCLRKRADEAARYASIPPPRAVSPQCGSASTLGGNPLPEADERATLTRCVQAARTVWS